MSVMKYIKNWLDSVQSVLIMVIGGRTWKFVTSIRDRLRAILSTLNMLHSAISRKFGNGVREVIIRDKNFDYFYSFYL